MLLSLRARLSEAQKLAQGHCVRFAAPRLEIALINVGQSVYQS